MAVLETLVVELTAETDQFSKKLKGADQEAQGWASGLGGKVAGLAGGVVAGAAVAAVGAISAIGVAAFNVSSDVNTATADIAASLGIPTEEAERFAEVAKRVYGNNFADSVGDAAAAVKNLAQQMGLAADDPALQKMAEDAFRLRDTFDMDVGESISAAKTLMENFGISGQEAFDLIAAGNQKGLNRAGDLVDTIEEYSTQFKEGGASAEEFFSFIGTGIQGGMLGTDKAADLFKEFRVRIQDGSDSTTEALNAIGLSADDMAAGFADGSLTTIDAFNQVSRALRQTDDENLQFQAGVALLGTQFEDLGASVALGIDPLADGFGNVEGAVDSLDAKYATFGAAAEGIWRKLVVAVTPLTDALLNMVNAVMPTVMAAFDAAMPVIEGVVGAFTYLATVTAPLTTQWEDGSSVLGAFIERLGVGEKTAYALGNAIAEFAKGAQATFNNAISFVSNLFTSKFGPAVEGGTGILEYFKGWVDKNLPLVQTLFQNILGAIQGFWDMFGADIMHIVSNTFDTIFTIIDTVLRTIGDLVTLVLQVLTGDWEGAGETLIGITERIWETIKTVIGNQLDSIWTAVTLIDWAELGNSIIQGMIEGIVSMSTRLWEAAKGISQDLWNRLTRWWATGSPSKKSQEGLGEPIGEGISLGIPDGLKDTMGRVEGAMAGLFNGLQGAQGGGLAGAGGVVVHQNFYGATDPEAVRGAAREGVLAAARSMGMR